MWKANFCARLLLVRERSSLNQTVFLHLGQVAGRRLLRRLRSEQCQRQRRKVPLHVVLAWIVAPQQLLTHPYALDGLELQAGLQPVSAFARGVQGRERECKNGGAVPLVNKEKNLTLGWPRPALRRSSRVPPGSIGRGGARRSPPAAARAASRAWQREGEKSRPAQKSYQMKAPLRPS